MSKILEIPHNRDKCLYTNPNYEVFHLTNIDKNDIINILITNKKEEDDPNNSKCSTDSGNDLGNGPIGLIRTLDGISLNSEMNDGSAKNPDLVELLVPIMKDYLVSEIPYFKNLLNSDNLFGDKSYVEIDGKKCLVVKDPNPRAFAEILKMLFTDKLELNCENCMDYYRIADYLNIPSKKSENSEGETMYLTTDIKNFIDSNIKNLEKKEFYKIFEYKFQDRFRSAIDEYTINNDYYQLKDFWTLYFDYCNIVNKYEHDPLHGKQQIQ